ncbi:MAG TPA: thermonuclease family protein [Pyrinomonadaceae bacterium]|nr:thermonuclease family protein [Pyrinomonadaceae bacterium]
MKSVRLVFIALIVGFGFACTSERPLQQPSPSKEIRGIVIAVADGDTLTVLDMANRQHRVRLKGIDAPEDSQAFSSVARQALVSLTFHRAVLVQYDDFDVFGRALGKVLLEDRDINHQLLQDGVAWLYREYESDLPAQDRNAYRQAELSARTAGRGLWTDKNPMPPWEYRKLHRDRTQTEVTVESQIEPTPDSRDTYIVGNVRSRVYHRPDCPGYRDVSPKNAVHFRTPEDAEIAGYRVAGNCP